MQGRFVDSLVNCLLAIIALPLGLGLLGYGVYLCAKRDPDTGSFLIVLGLLTGSVGWGYVGARAKVRRKDLRGRKLRGGRKA